MFNQAKQYVAAQDLPRALQSFSEALKLAPHLAPIQYATAVLQKSLGMDAQVATDHFRKASMLEPAVLLWQLFCACLLSSRSQNVEYGNAYAHALKGIADWETLEQQAIYYEKRVAMGGAFHPFSALMFGFSPEVVLRESKREGQKHDQAARELISAQKLTKFAIGKVYGSKKRKHWKRESVERKLCTLEIIEKFGMEALGMDLDASALCDANGVCDTANYGQTDKKLSLNIAFMSSNFINHAQGAQLSTFFDHHDSAIGKRHPRHIASTFFCRVNIFTVAESANESNCHSSVIAIGASCRKKRRSIYKCSNQKVKRNNWTKKKKFTFCSDVEIFRLLRKLKIDILVDLCGLADEARPIVMAMRPTAVVVSFLGYAHSEKFIFFFKKNLFF